MATLEDLHRLAKQAKQATPVEHSLIKYTKVDTGGPKGPKGGKILKNLKKPSEITSEDFMEFCVDFEDMFGALELISHLKKTLIRIIYAPNHIHKKEIEGVIEEIQGFLDEMDCYYKEE